MKPKKHHAHWRFRVPHGRKTTFEHKDAGLFFRSTRNGHGETIWIEVAMPQRHHADWFWRQLMRGALDVAIALRLFPDVKEQSESVAGYMACTRLLSPDEMKTADVVVVGDGSTPRTAYVCAALGFGAQVLSVDPCMQTDLPVLPANLRAFARRIEEAPDFFQPTSRVLVVVAVHSHALFEDYMDTLLALSPATRVVVVAIPCCVPQEMSDELLRKFALAKVHDADDLGILSPCRRVVAWARGADAAA